MELHNVTIGQRIQSLSLTVEGGQIVSVKGARGVGKTTLLRAVLGFLAIDGGHISIDGELLTPLSAPYFRRHTAYVPQKLSLPDDYDERGLERWELLTDDERYLLLLTIAVQSGKSLLVVDEPSKPLSAEAAGEAARLLREAARQGATVLAVNAQIFQKQIEL